MDSNNTTPYRAPTANLGNILTATARAHGDRVGFIHGDDSYTWREIEDSANALATALVALGVKKGDRVAIQSKNSRAMFESMYAITRTGAVYVPISSYSTPYEVCQMAGIGDIVLLIAEAQFAEHMQAAAAQCPQVKNIIFVGKPDESIKIEGAAVHDHADLIARNLAAPTVSVAVTNDDICWQNFTSGTTGTPKSGMNSHGGIHYRLVNVIATMFPDIGPSDSNLAIAPIGHGTGTVTTTCTLVGAATILPSTAKMDVDHCWSLIEKHKISIIFAVPTILLRLLKDPSFRRERAASLRHIRCGASPMTRAELEFALSHIGDKMVRPYGAVEMVGAGLVFRPAKERLPEDAVVDEANDPLNSIGRPRLGTQLGVFDDDMNELAIGEVGEICVRSPGTFAGYYKNPEANAEVFTKGWVRSGDIGRIDARGFVYLQGRRKEMFKWGGLQISPNEIQNHLGEHPAIDEAHLAPVPDSDFEQVGVAVLRLKPGAETTEGQLIQFIRDRLASFKQPRRIFIVDDIPRSLLISTQN